MCQGYIHVMLLSTSKQPSARSFIIPTSEIKKQRLREPSYLPQITDAVRPELQFDPQGASIPHFFFLKRKRTCKEKALARLGGRGVLTLAITRCVDHFFSLRPGLNLGVYTHAGPLVCLLLPGFTTRPIKITLGSGQHSLISKARCSGLQSQGQTGSPVSQMKTLRTFVKETNGHRVPQWKLRCIISLHVQGNSGRWELSVLFSR